MAVASFQPAAVVYREEQNFDWRAYALVFAVEVLWGVLLWKLKRAADPAALLHLDAIEVPVGIAIFMALPVVIIVGFLRMTTEVTPTDLRVWFGWVPTYRRAIDAGMVRRAEVVTYRPWADCRGWGVRTGRDGERVLNARGNRGVRLELSDGSLLVIGSQRPEDLARAITTALQPPT